MIDEIEILKELLKGTQNPIILDIGAADMTHSQMFRHIFPEAKIFAVEPDHNYKEHNEMMSSAYNIDYTYGVLCDTNSPVRFYPSTSYLRIGEEKWSGSGSIFTPNQEVIDTKYPTLSFDETGYEVPGYTWEAFMEMKGITHIDYLHIDTQGAEYSILKMIDKTFPLYIFSEICEFDTYNTGTTRDRFDDMLYQKNYVCIGDDGANALYIRAQKIIDTK